VCDGLRLLQHYLSPGSVNEIHCYHPQPYQHPAQFHRRLITPGFLALVHRALQGGGRFFIQSDNPGYWSYIRALASLFFDFQEREGPWPDAPRGRTRREIIALRRGLPLFRGSGSPKPGLTLEEVLPRAEALSRPEKTKEEEEE
jgi:tRNA (guanine-N7-)-methyltransferase